MQKVRRERDDPQVTTVLHNIWYKSQPYPYKCGSTDAFLTELTILFYLPLLNCRAGFFSYGVAGLQVI